MASRFIQTRLAATPVLFLIFISFALAGAPVRYDSLPLPEGIWRGEMLRPDGHTVFFNFQTLGVAGKKKLDIRNGKERLRVDDIVQLGDSFFIEMPFFDSRFALRLTAEKILEGNWIKNYGARVVTIPFRAVFGGQERFPTTRSPAANITGRWSTRFKRDRDSTEAVGEFKQTGARVTGTFLTPTGDYRYLEGIVNGDSLRLSTFDGGHVYSFESKIESPTRMQGQFYSGATSIETWTAEKNDAAKLPDEFGLSRLRDSARATLQFRFPDLNGKMRSLSDPEFKNKVVIIQILGSWCPNCMDETRFLGPWYVQNKPRGIAVVGLAYERTASFADAKRLLQPFIRRFNVTYPILATGVTVDDSLRTEKTLPEIDRIVGFPTTLFIDKKGRVRKIDTGFNGPGTGEHYEQFKKEFDRIVNNLLAE